MARRSVVLTAAALFLLLAVLLGSIAWVSYLRGRQVGPVFGDKVAVVEIKGIITESRPICEKLAKLSRDSSIKALVLRIESPGGGVSPSQELYKEIRRVGRRKPVVVSMGAVAASGGYYIATAARKIYANPGTITGSIGVILQFTNFEQLFKKIGFRMETIKSGAYKDVGNPTRKMTRKERAYLQEMVDNVHRQFIKDVARGRHLPVARVSKVADGRIFTGEQAKRLGLVDELGDLKDAINAAARMAGIKGEPKVVYPEKKKRSLLNYLLNLVAERIGARLRPYPGLLLLYPLGARPSWARFY